MTIRTASTTETYVRLECPRCGTKFFVGATAYEWYMRIQGAEIYCPVGHAFIRSSADPDYKLDRERAPFLKLVVEQVEPVQPALSPITPNPVKRNRKKACETCGKTVKDLKGHMARMHGVTV